MKIGLVSAVAMLALALTSTAFAQAPTPSPAPIKTADYTSTVTGSDQVVTFTGDPLGGDDHSVFGYEIRLAPRVARAGLIRPRVNFVSELLKSVENL